jgi:NAD(P)H-hydrate epimerase
MASRPLSRAEVREVDRRAIEEYGMSGLVLMENAGRGCVDALRQLGCQGPAVVVCGKGNNAGDGFVIARHLDLLDIPVKVVLLGPSRELRGDAAANYCILSRSQFEILEFSQRFEPELFQKALAGAEWIVDALLGTGATGPPRPPLDAAIRLMNASPAKRLAVDLPSGLDCDTGAAADPTFQADHTCTFVAEKIGFFNPRARRWLGQIHVVDIGVPARLLFEIAAAGP